MNSEISRQNSIDIARMATDITIALMADKNGHLTSLMHEGKIPRGASPLAIFDEIYAHITSVLSKA